MVVLPFPFHTFMPLANLWLIRQFPILRTRSCLDSTTHPPSEKAVGTLLNIFADNPISPISNTQTVTKTNHQTDVNNDKLIIAHQRGCSH